MWYSPSGSPSNKPDGSNIWSGIVYCLWGYPIQIAHSLGNKIYSRTGYPNNGSIVWNDWNQIARLEDIASLFILDIKANTWTNHDLFYMLQNIIVPGTGIDNHTVNIMATVNGIPCNRLHVANGIQEFWTPETQVIKQYSYNDMNVCTDNIKVVACRL